MPTPNEKLAESLDELKELQQGNRRVFRSDDLSRVHRERLAENGFLQEVMKGWLISSSPDAEPGESTPWHASFWEFCSRYCDERFGDQWHLSPEQSLFLHGERTVIPDQLVVHSPKATNNDIQLLFGTTLYDLKVAEMPAPGALMVRDGLRLFTPAAALVRVPESFFQLYPLEAQVVMASLADASDLLRLLLNGGHSAKAGYLAKAFRQTGRPELADEILRAMKGAGYDVRESSPFEAGQIFRKHNRPAAGIVSRVEMLWGSMRGKVIASFPKPPGLPADKQAYLRFVDEIYRTDAYHSLSIEGYSVTPSLVERVRHGDWDPAHNVGDRRNRDALAARGYWQAFQLVKKAVEKVIVGEHPAELARAAHNDWYRELFQPCVTAGLLEPGTLAGYRNIPVYLRMSRYIPPRWEAMRDAMPAFFDLLEKEPEPSVRAVLGHWLFGYIHPYPDGNGRMARFLMNVMLASGGYPWTVIRVVDRKSYLSALDRASIEMDIHPFTNFIVRRVEWRLEPHDVTFPAPMESLVFGRDMVLFYGQDGEAVVRCAITGEALENHFHGTGKDKLDVFRANRQPIENEVRRRYLAGDTELDGSILIRSGDLPDNVPVQSTRTSAPPPEPSRSDATMLASSMPKSAQDIATISPEIVPKYEPVIGLEVHVQLLTRTKIFCGCSTRFGDPPNSNVCPVCLGLPGALPVLNKRAVEMAMRAALAINCTVHDHSRFARKNYFYPDLPKGYQISQYELPLATGGWLDIEVAGAKKRIGITRLHLEDDAAKNLHEGFAQSATKSYIDYNRGGTPLVEIVSEPDIRSSEEAYAYLTTLRQILLYTGVSDVNMEEGSLRCDANVSVRLRGSKEFGIKVEVKNLNSFRFLQKALEYEIERHISVLESGGRISQETRLWNQAEGHTVSMRSKEKAHDYRYFPEPDLLPVHISSAWREEVLRSLPELPEAKRNRFVSAYSITPYDAEVLTTTQALADYFESVVKAGAPGKAAANWMQTELLRGLKDSGKEITESPITPAALAELVRLVESSKITGTVAKKVFATMFESGRTAADIVAAEGLGAQVSNSAIEDAARDVIAKNPDNVAKFKSGNEGVFKFFVGQVMKATRGQANPQSVNDTLKRLLTESK